MQKAQSLYKKEYIIRFCFHQCSFKPLTHGMVFLQSRAKFAAEHLSELNEDVAGDFVDEVSR